MIVITRRDLSPGYQAIQASHAAIEFQHGHQEIAKEWNQFSKYLVFLSVENEEQLKELYCKAKDLGIRTSEFLEPDIENQLTAVALEPCQISRKITSNLPLALKQS